MKTFHLKEDLKVFGFQAKTFPTGIGKAFDNLVKMLPEGLYRSYYGISYATQPGIVYLATAIENYAGEAEKYNCERYSISKGEYLVVTVRDWRNKTDSIKEVFQEIMQEDCPDKSSPCVEWYKDDNEMLCMVRIDESKRVSLAR